MIWVIVYLFIYLFHLDHSELYDNLSFCASGNIRAPWPTTFDSRWRKITENFRLQSKAESSICANLDEVMVLNLNVLLQQRKMHICILLFDTAFSPTYIQMHTYNAEAFHFHSFSYITCMIPFYFGLLGHANLFCNTRV